jgi:regulator of cell morphogenesis and NO signaling
MTPVEADDPFEQPEPLRKRDPPPAPSGRDTLGLEVQPLSAVVKYVVWRHHGFARREMPRIDRLVGLAARMHGARHPNLFPPLTSLWARFRVDFEVHLLQEETVLFPAIESAEAGGRRGLRCGNLDAPVLCAEIRHDEETEALARIRRVADGFAVPRDAGATWRSLCVALDAFERDLREHVRIENDLLFPRVRALDLLRR